MKHQKKILINHRMKIVLRYHKQLKLTRWNQILLSHMQLLHSVMLCTEQVQNDSQRNDAKTLPIHIFLAPVT